MMNTSKPCVASTCAVVCLRAAGLLASNQALMLLHQQLLLNKYVATCVTCKMVRRA
jgi:hypothetical protein